MRGSQDLPSGSLPHFNDNEATLSRRIHHNTMVERRLLREAERATLRAAIVAARREAAAPLTEYWPYGIGLDDPIVHEAGLLVPKTLPEDVRAEACQRVVLLLLEGKSVNVRVIIAHSWASNIRVTSIEQRQELDASWLDIALYNLEGQQRRGPGAQW
jgi:hypothetical protein